MQKSNPNVNLEFAKIKMKTLEEANKWFTKKIIVSSKNQIHTYISNLQKNQRRVMQKSNSHVHFEFAKKNKGAQIKER